MRTTVAIFIAIANWNSNKCESHTDGAVYILFSRSLYDWVYPTTHNCGRSHFSYILYFIVWSLDVVTTIEFLIKSVRFLLIFASIRDVNMNGEMDFVMMDHEV